MRAPRDRANATPLDLTIAPDRIDTIAKLLRSISEYDPDFPTDVIELVEPNAAASAIVGEGVRTRARLVQDVVDCVRSNGLRVSESSATVRLAGVLRSFASATRRTAPLVEIIDAIVRNAPVAAGVRRRSARPASPRPLPSRSQNSKASRVAGVRAFLSVFSFPADPDSLRLEADEHGRLETPCDQVFAGPSNWSAPRHAEVGDVCFFYCSKRSLKNVRRVRRILEAEGRLHTDLRRFLERAESQAEQYSGRIVAYSFVTGRAHSDDRLADDNYDWQSRTLAPMGSGSVLQMPIELMRFRGELPFPHGQTIVPLQPSHFERLIEVLQTGDNALDPRLLTVTPVSIGRTKVTRANWRKVACAPAHRFVNEQEVRGDFIDHLLEEIRDLRSTVEHEVDCRSGGQVLGRVDYVVRVRGHDVPVEAKLNVQTEENLPRQMRRYLEAEEFVAFGRARAVVLRAPRTSRGLVIDSAGAYVLNSRGFVDCAPDAPLIRRSEIQSLTRKALQSKIANALGL